jgi:hypothetical protein
VSQKGIQEDAVLHTRTDYVQHVEVMLLNEQVEMGVDEDKSGTGSPMAQETRLDVVCGDFLYGFGVSESRRREEKRRHQQTRSRRILSLRKIIAAAM